MLPVDLIRKATPRAVWLIGLEGTVYDALTSDTSDARAYVLRTDIDHLSLVPANRQLTGAEIELVTLDKREYRLRRFIEPLRADFDYIFIDTPPSLGLLTLNALVAADSVLIPLNCEYFALEGIADLIATLDRAPRSIRRRRRGRAHDG
jgi:chromosome partitioning protein